jgi:hypothetical protein
MPNPRERARNYRIIKHESTNGGLARKSSLWIDLLNNRSKQDIRLIITQILEDIAGADSQLTEREDCPPKGNNSDVIMLFLYPSNSDYNYHNHIGRVQWINKDAAARFAPLKMEGESIEHGSTVHWNNAYEEMHAFLSRNESGPEVFLSQLKSILAGIEFHIQKADSFVSLLNAQAVEPDVYLDMMSALELEVRILWERAQCLGVCPPHMGELSQYFQQSVAMAHNCLIPFAKADESEWCLSKQGITQCIHYITLFKKDLYSCHNELAKGF